MTSACDGVSGTTRLLAIGCTVIASQERMLALNQLAKRVVRMDDPASDSGQN